MQFDLHVHIESVRKKHFLPEIFKYASKVGLNGLAITEHDDMNEYARYKKEADRAGLILIPAEEVSAKEGDILVYGLQESILGKGLSVDEVIEKTHAQDAIAVAAHPYYPFRSVNGLIEKARFDGVEVLNARGELYGESNVRARKICDEIGIIKTAGSDAHRLEWIGKGRVSFSNEITNTDDAIAELKRKDHEILNLVNGRMEAVFEFIRNKGREHLF